MASGSQAKLVLTLTHDCNLRCPYCPLTKSPAAMDRAVVDQAARVFFGRHPAGPRTVKFFGGEPMLSFPLIRETVSRLRREHGGNGLSFFLSTNATLLDGSALAYFRDNPDIELAVSGVLDAGALRGLPNFHLNIPVPPRLAGRLAGYVARLLRAGLTRLNFLPAYYLPWNPAQIRELQRQFALAAALIRRAQAEGKAVHVRNLTQWAPTPLYNHGMVVSPEGDVYPCNLVFSKEFLHLQPELRLGRVQEPDSIDWDKTSRLRYDRLLAEHLPAPVHRSTLAVDAALTRFVRSLN